MYSFKRSVAHFLNLVAIRDFILYPNYNMAFLLQPALFPPAEPVGNSDRLSLRPILLLQKYVLCVLQYLFSMFETVQPFVVGKAKPFHPVQLLQHSLVRLPIAKLKFYLCFHPQIYLSLSVIANLKLIVQLCHNNFIIDNFFEFIILSQEAPLNQFIACTRYFFNNRIT